MRTLKWLLFTDEPCIFRNFSRRAKIIHFFYEIEQKTMKAQAKPAEVQNFLNKDKSDRSFSMMK